MGPIGSGGGADGAGGNADDLSDVTLNHFTATPSDIGPFDTSQLSWHVSGVMPPVRVLLDNLQVAAVGQAIVQPALTTNYTLSAVSGSARKTLGHAIVNVDRSTCDEEELPNLLALLREQIIIGVNAQNPQQYWSGNTDDPNILSVSLSHDSPARIVIRAVLRQRIPWFSDPWVTLELSFGLGIRDGAFYAVVPQSKGDVEFDRVTWFFGGIILGLALALNNANEKASAAGLAVIDGLITWINTVELHPDVGKQARNAVAEYRNNKPFVGYVQCGLGSRGATVVLTGGERATSRIG